MQCSFVYYTYIIMYYTLYILYTLYFINDSFYYSLNTTIIYEIKDDNSGICNLRERGWREGTVGGRERARKGKEGQREEREDGGFE